MNRLSYPGKFALIGVLALVSVTILVVALATNLYESIRLARRELVVTELILPLQQLIQLTQQHRGIAAAYLSGDASLQTTQEAKRAEVDAAHKRAAEHEAGYVALLGSSAEWRDIAADWQRLNTGLRDMRAAAALAQHTQLIMRLLRFEEAIADAGGLSIDSELHTYYLGRTVVKNLPDILERLGKIRAKGTEVLVHKRLSVADRIELTVHANLLDNAFQSLRQELGKVGRESPAIALTVQRSTTEIAVATARAASLLDSDILGETFALTPREFFERFTQAIDIGYREMFATLLPTLNQQLEARIARLRAYLLLEVGLALTFLLLLTYASVGAYHSVIESVRRLSAGAGRLANGDLRARIQLEGRDELVTVGESFNAMASALDHLLQQSKQTASELAAALAEAQRADQLKDAFLANVSHELRTPLNAVIGFADLARRPGCAPERQLDYLLKIGNAGNSLANVVNDLLDLSKIAAGRMELDPATFSLRHLLSRVCSIMSFKVSEKGLQLTDKVDSAVPDLLVGDSLRIEQLLLNLLSNAVKFTDRGRIEMRITLDVQQEERVCLRIEVEDSGIGIKAEEIGRLFQPFTQADASMGRKYGGTGLGLALCRRLAQMMDGNIDVNSLPGSGSTFGVKLWLGRGDAADLAPESAPAEAPAQGLRYRSARVLVVDDQAMNREIAEELLASVGIEVRSAEHGQAALDLLAAAVPGAFDLVLMDIQMPVMDGLSATRALRARPEFKDLPIIAMTAHTMEHERANSAAAGLNDHIGKPFETANFYGVLARWIAKEKREGPQPPTLASAAPTSPATLAESLATLAGVDAVAGLARFNGNCERYRHWLGDFVAGADAIPEQLRSELARGDAAQAARTAHAFKGRVGMLGLTELFASAAALERALREGAAADHLISGLALSIRQWQGQLRRVLGGQVKDSPGTASLAEINWSDAFSVGVAELDEQHKKLIALINRLAAYARLGSAAPAATAAAHTSQREPAGAVHELLSELFDYTRRHFKAEEEHMQSIGYARLPAHVAEHAVFLEKIAGFTIASASGVVEAVKMHRYLLEWFTEHILAADMGYSDRSR